MPNNGASMSQGGLVGYYTVHNYNHIITSKDELEANVGRLMTYALKGVATDAIIFQTFTSLGTIATFINSEWPYDACKDIVWLNELHATIGNDALCMSRPVHKYMSTTRTHGSWLTFFLGTVLIFQRTDIV
ncbi:hypothetical protein OCU04_005754 [Sclerotinia nivalis]|uniref:Uncharacterized protein n=1 Tax=Sclerotinia nivalis TaxID=352851 RepID=A0A9X0ALL4_9HELO|nr:hypothetical protein OCU04_005754 [Sclerotinia nivalis]